MKILDKFKRSNYELWLSDIIIISGQSLLKCEAALLLVDCILSSNISVGGAVAEWSKALLVRENKRKSKRSQVRPPTWAPFEKVPISLQIQI